MLVLLSVYLPESACHIRRIHQGPRRHLHVGRVPQVLRPVLIGNLCEFGKEVHALGIPVLAHRLKLRGLQQLQQRHSTARRGRHGDHQVSAVAPFKWRAPNGTVGTQILRGKPALGPFHQASGMDSLVKCFWTSQRNIF